MSISKIPTELARQRFRELLSMWTEDRTDPGQRQATLYQHDSQRDFRLDRQSNGDFSHSVNGEKKVAYRNFAIQEKEPVYAAVNIPVGKNVGASLIREAFEDSRDKLCVVTIAIGVNSKYVITDKSWTSIEKKDWNKLDAPPASSSMTISKLPTEQERKDFAELLSMWTDDETKPGQGQGTLLQLKTKSDFRLNRLSNGDFSFLVNGERNKVAYRTFAIQGDKAVYAAVNIPVGKNVGASLIRDAFKESQESLSLVTIALGVNYTYAITEKSWKSIEKKDWNK